jgi:hypothetical protein
MTTAFPGNSAPAERATATKHLRPIFRISLMTPNLGIT